MWRTIALLAMAVVVIVTALLSAGGRAVELIRGVLKIVLGGWLFAANQITPMGGVNYFAYPVGALAGLEGRGGVG